MRFLPVVALGVLLLASPALAQDKPAAGKTLTATGVISAVSADSLTIKAKDTEWKFAVDKDTQVTGVGASRKTAALKKDKKPTVLTEYVKVGDSVDVKYHEMAGSKHAAEVFIRAALPGKK